MNLTGEEGRDRDGVDQSAQHPRGYEPGEEAHGDQAPEDQGPDEQGQQDQDQDQGRLSHPEQGPYQPEQGNQAIYDEDRQPDR